MAAYSSGSATVTTTPALLVTVGPTNDGVMIQNQGAVVVTLGGPNVTASVGIQVAANATVTIPSVGGASHDLWAVAASATATVTWLQPI